jgi:RNA polymerase sigma-70 factor (ECF subfamily)
MEFEAFYRAHADPVRRALAVTLGDAQVAGEAVDEAMTRALARWRQVAHLDSPAGWVYRVGLNWAISRWRRLRREGPLDGVEPEPLSPGAGDNPSATDLDVALRHLPVDQRAVIVCRTLLEYSTAETAAVLGVPEGTVKSRLARGLAALRTAVDDLADDIKEDA